MTISDIDRTPVYPTTDFTIEKITRISSIDIENGIELPKLPNGVGDRWLSDGTIERNVGYVKYVGNEGWYEFGQLPDSYTFYIPETTPPNIINPNTMLINNNYINYYTTYNNGFTYSFDNSILPSGFYDLSNYDKRTWVRHYLSENPLEIHYQLETPIIENAPTLPEFIDFYDGGSVIVDDGTIDYTVVGNQAQINYIEGNITTVEDGQFNISKPTKIISKSNDLYDYDLSNLPSYLEYGSLPEGTYENVIEFNDNNQNKQIKLFFDDNIQNSRYNVYLENNTIIISNDTEVIRIFNDDTYTSTKNLDTDITYKLEGYHILDYIDGKFDNTVLAFFWVIPALLVGGLIYLLLKRKE